MPLQNRPDQSAQTLLGIFNSLSSIERSKFGLLLRPVLHGFQIQGQNLSRAFLGLFVKSLPGLIAQPTALGHLLQKRRYLITLPGFVIRRGLINVFHHVRQHIEPHQIRGAKGRRSRPAHRRPRARVHLFHRHVQFAHQPEGIQHRERPDAIGNKIWRVLGLHHAFSQTPVAKFPQRLEHIARCLRPRNHLHQFQISRRIKKMRPAPMLLKLLAHPLGNQMHRQPGSIGGNNRPRFAKRRHTLQQLPLDLQILRHHFNNPVGLRHPR